MRLYKYASPDRVDILLSGLIRFTPLHVLNDLFECAPPFEGFLPSWVEEELQQLLNRHGQEYLVAAAWQGASSLKLSKECRLALCLLMASQVERVQVGDVVRQWLSRQAAKHQTGAGLRIQRTLGDRFGVLSLSESATNPLMWSYYADSHRGLVIEIEVTEAFPEPAGPKRAGSMADFIGTPQKVSYDPDRPAWVMYDPLGRRFGDRIRDLFLRKNIQWQHEKEWRLIYPLTRPRLYPHTMSGSCHLFPLVRSGIKAVWFGARASADTVTAVQDALATVPVLNGVALLRCRPSDTTYEMLADEVKPRTLDHATEKGGA